MTLDNPDQAGRAFRLLQAVEAGDRTVLIPEGVLVETVQVLSSTRLYDVDREVIRARLGPILRMASVKVTNKRTYARALDLYVEDARLSFVDALCVAHAQRSPDSTVLSFDQDYRNIPGLKWEEP